MSTVPKVSVITATYKGEKRIVNLLGALQKQNFTDFEYIVVLDGENELTKNLLNQVVFPSGRPVIIQNVQNVGRPVSLNRGAQQAKGDLIVFFDDDMIPEPDCLQRHVTYHENQKSDSLLFGNGYRNPEHAKTDFQKFLIEAEKEWKKPYPKAFEISLERFTATTCNISLPKRLFFKAGMFDSRLRDAEDVNLSMKLMELGAPLYHDSSVLAWHHDFPSLSLYVHRLKQYKVGNETLLKYFPDYEHKIPHLYQRKTHSLLKTAVLKAARILPLRNIDIHLQRMPWIPQRIKSVIFHFAISVLM